MISSCSRLQMLLNLPYKVHNMLASSVCHITQFQITCLGQNCFAAQSGHAQYQTSVTATTGAVLHDACVN